MYRNRAVAFLANLFYQLQLIRLKVERALGRMFSGGARYRVIATACWSFPIYSQTFVYQELTQLILRGFEVRFLYSNLNRQEPLPSQFARLWRSRRRLILHPAVCERSYAYFLKRMPQKIDMLVDMLSRASGLSSQELRSDRHFLQAFSFARMVEAYRPDYLHSYFFYEGSLFALIASYLLDIPRGVSCYADHVLKDYSLKVVPLHLRQCSLVIATSRRIKRELINIERAVDSERILIKSNAINVTRFPVMNRREPDKGGPYRLVCVSRLEPKKGLIYLVEAVGYLREAGINAELHLIGDVDDSVSSKDYALQLHARIEELNLNHVIHLEGRKSESDINRFFEISHLFIAPFVETENGDKDGIPTSLLEAMSSGFPVVATDAGSIREVIEDGHNGVLVPQHDSRALATAVADLIAEPERRLLLGTNAAQTIRSEFDVKICEHVFQARLLELLASTRRMEIGFPMQDEMRKKPVVSVITIFFNAERFIEEAIESVLLQTYDDWELLLVDDGSTDGSSEIARRYARQYQNKVRYLEHDGHQNLGMSATRNLGIRSATGEYVAFLDADDMWLPHKLARQVAILESQPQAAMVYGAAQYWHSWTGDSEDLKRDVVPDHGIQTDVVFKPPALATLLYPLGKGSAPCPSDLLMRRNMIERVGGFEEDFRGQNQLYEDQAFLAKVYLKESVFVSSESWVKYRIHPDSCVSAVTRDGHYETVRRFFMNWLEQYLSNLTISDTRVADALQEALYQDYGVRASAETGYGTSLFERPSNNGHSIARPDFTNQGVQASTLNGGRFGMLRRVTPISTKWGFDRGLPIDRHYIENFLAVNADDIRGGVLEIGDNSYTRRFGNGRSHDKRCTARDRRQPICNHCRRLNLR